VTIKRTSEKTLLDLSACPPAPVARMDFTIAINRSLARAGSRSR